MTFNWEGFTENDFVNYCAMMENFECCDIDYIGCVRVGNLCFDLVVRVYGEFDFKLDYDLYIGGIDDGYGYGKNDYPYTECGGGTFEDSGIGLTYDEFKKQAEILFEKFISDNDLGRNYSLIEKASEPLYVW